MIQFHATWYAIFTHSTKDLYLFERHKGKPINTYLASNIDDAIEMAILNTNLPDQWVKEDLYPIIATKNGLYIIVVTPVMSYANVPAIAVEAIEAFYNRIIVSAYLQKVVIAPPMTPDMALPKHAAQAPPISLDVDKAATKAATKALNAVKKGGVKKAKAK